MSPRLRSTALALAVATLFVAALGEAAQASLNVYFQATLKDDAYQKKTFSRVAKAWKAPPSSAIPKVGSKAVVRAVIAKDGKLVSANLWMESGSKRWDDASVAAVKAAAPFDPLPTGYKYPTIEVHFHVAVVP